MSARVLFIEDEPAFAVGTMDRLRAEGYSVEWEANGSEGYERACREAYDLILLDVMLPGKNGFDVCRDLRRQGIQVPILMLTARGEVIDRVLGLKLGADDYVQKNCEPIELMARVEALLRRRAPAAAAGGTLVAIGEVRVDLKNHEVLRNGELVPLSPVEFRLLSYLLERRGILVTREELLEKVWAMHGDTLSRTVDVHIAGLRKKIEADPRYPRFLITVKGAGYKLNP